jgi:hypothetical protein
VGIVEWVGRAFAGGSAVPFLGALAAMVAVAAVAGPAARQLQHWVATPSARSPRRHPPTDG